MADKFIPNGDLAFGQMALNFAQVIGKDPERLTVSAEDAAALSAAVARYRAALQTCRSGGTRSTGATIEKDEARAEAERQVRRIAHMLRANDRIDRATKFGLGLRERQGKAKPTPCPNEPPLLRFVRALHEGNGATPMHELSFMGIGMKSMARPAGAARLELFVDLVPPEEPIPKHPGANLGGRPWYVRSYTRSPIVLSPPMARVPMRVVYWGRWADSAGNVGPFSATAVGWVEGGSHLRSLAPALGSNRALQQLEEATLPGPISRELTYGVAVLEAQYQSLNPQLSDGGAGKGQESRQLEGPTEAEAA